MKSTIKFVLLLTALLIAAPAFTQKVNKKVQHHSVSGNRILPQGGVFNESVWMVDSVTGRPVLRLTQNRDFNVVPTYHLNACFSADSRYIVFSTSSAGHGSAIIHADITNGDCRVIAHTEERAKPISICIVPRSDYVASSSRGVITVYNLKTLDQRVLYKAPQGESCSAAAASMDGSKIYVCQLPGNPQNPHYYRMSVIEIEIATGRSKVIFSDTSRGKHVIPNPVYPELLLIDRDFPSRQKSYTGLLHTRSWIFNIKNGSLTEIRSNNPNRFYYHTNWSYDGKYVYYHGVAKNTNNHKKNTNAHYIGVADLDGKVVWESTFPYFYYGHMCSHTQKHALFTDGLLFPNLITELDWSRIDTHNTPSIVIYGAHNSGSHQFGQHAHPHCHMSPDAQKIAYNKGSEKRSDVYILFTDQAVKR